MSKENEYIKKIEEARRRVLKREHSRQFKRNYREGRKEHDREHEEYYFRHHTTGRPATPHSFDLGLARKYLKKGADKGNLTYAIKGADAYYSLGHLDNPSIHRLLTTAAIKALENLNKYGPDDQRKILHQVYEVEEIINLSKKANKLEKTVEIVVALVGIFIGLIFLSSSGNVQLSPGVGNALSDNWRFWLGGLLFILGLTGAFFYFKKN